MKRRRFLRPARASGLGAFATCLGVAQASASGSSETHRRYDGESGPDYWAELMSEYSGCHLGLQRFPIDLTDGVGANNGSVDLSRLRVPLSVVNDGHTIQVHCPAGSHVNLDGERYNLAQFHFHHLSEHHQYGAARDMEVHFVHVGGNGKLAVVGIFMNAGSSNPVLAPIWQAMPQEADETVEAPTMITPAGLLPSNRDYYRYLGSLTKPLCSQRVTRTVFRKRLRCRASSVPRCSPTTPVPSSLRTAGSCCNRPTRNPELIKKHPQIQAFERKTRCLCQVCVR